MYHFLFNKQKAIKELNRLHEEYVLVLDDKACRNIFLIRIVIINVLLMNWAFILQLIIVLTL
jgi:hypothetical protein